LLDSSLFETSAEIAVAFAGFIGIFLALVARDGRFPPKDAIAIRTIVVCSLAPVFYAFLPLVLYSLRVPSPILWRVSSGVTASVAMLLTVITVRHGLRLPASERSPLKNLDVFLGWAAGAVANVCWVANVIAWPWAPSAGMHLAGVWSIITIAAVHFAILIFSRVLADSTADV
jgi:hypothetical protein